MADLRRLVISGIALASSLALLYTLLLMEPHGQVLVAEPNAFIRRFEIGMMLAFIVYAGFTMIRR